MSLDQRYIVNPVRKALQLLDELAAGGRPMSLSELAGRAALPKTTAFRYLYTLRIGGFVKHDAETERYTIGARVALSAPMPDFLDRLKQTVQPTMRRLQRQFNETVNLGVRDGAEIAYVDMVGSTRSLRMEALIGSRDPLYSTALGKALLAAMPEGDMQEAIPKRMLARTKHTLATRQSLLADIAACAARGYALDMEENEVGARCVAAAIRAPGDPAPVAALSISGPAPRMTPAILAKMGAALARAVAGVSIQTNEA